MDSFRLGFAFITGTNYKRSNRLSFQDKIDKLVFLAYGKEEGLQKN